MRRSPAALSGPLRFPACCAVLVAVLVVARVAAAQTEGQDDSDNDVEAGGLKPPPPGSGPPGEDATRKPPSETEKQLDDSEKKDSGRGLEFVYFNVEGGFQQVGLTTLSTKQLVPGTVSTSSGGPMFGVGAGLRLLFLTIGPRFRIGHFSDWDVWSLNLEGGLHIPLGSFEPYFTLGGGFTKLGQVSQAGLDSDAGVSIRGFNVRGGFGLDYYVTNTFTVGANLNGEVLILTRPGTTINSVTQPPAMGTDCTMGTPAQMQACAQSLNGFDKKVDGSSVGMSTTLTAVFGLHF